MAHVTLINNYYPITYFADQNIEQVAPTAPNQYWASQQEYAPAAEHLIFDFGTVRPVNFVDFEISTKPFDIKVYYDTGGDWVEVASDDEFEADLSIAYLASIENPWTYFEYHFDVVQTRYIKIEFIRREDPFPFLDSEPIEYSVEVRNLRLMHVISRFDEFIPDSGKDILGNTYRTDSEYYGVEHVDDDDGTTFWQSQPNPSRFAVEALYFDLRQGYQVGNMGYLNTQEMESLDTRSMTNMAVYFEDAVVIDEVYVDPVTVGPIMHIYYSLDDEPEWDNKLWTPIPRHYVLRKGFHSLPRPILTKYVKLEFSQLTPAPYNMPEYPQMPQITYRKYPTWVQNYFNDIYITRPGGNFINPVERVDIDPLRLGFTKDLDRLDSGLETRHLPTVESTDPELREFIAQLVNTQATDEDVQRESEDQIEINTSFMWQRDLIANLDTDRALSRIAQEGETGFNSELPPITEAPPTAQSVSNLEQAREEKEIPIMWFPIRCRHGYQIIKANRPAKIAYFVAIREVKFHRRDYTVEFDEPFYVETLFDSDHTEVNDFVQDGWRFRVDE